MWLLLLNTLYKKKFRRNCNCFYTLLDFDNISCLFILIWSPTKGINQIMRLCVVHLYVADSTVILITFNNLILLVYYKSRGSLTLWTTSTSFQADVVFSNSELIGIGTNLKFTTSFTVQLTTWFVADFAKQLAPVMLVSWFKSSWIVEILII